MRLEEILNILIQSGTIFPWDSWIPKQCIRYTLPEIVILTLNTWVIIESFRKRRPHPLITYFWIWVVSREVSRLIGVGYVKYFSISLAPLFCAQCNSLTSRALCAEVLHFERDYDNESQNLVLSKLDSCQIIDLLATSRARRGDFESKWSYCLKT